MVHVAERHQSQHQLDDAYLGKLLALPKGGVERGEPEEAKICSRVPINLCDAVTRPPDPQRRVDCAEENEDDVIAGLYRWLIEISYRR